MISSCLVSGLSASHAAWVLRTSTITPSFLSPSLTTNCEENRSVPSAVAASLHGPLYQQVLSHHQTHCPHLAYQPRHLVLPVTRERYPSKDRLVVVGRCHTVSALAFSFVKFLCPAPAPRSSVHGHTHNDDIIVVVVVIVVTDPDRTSPFLAYPIRCDVLTYCYLFQSCPLPLQPLRGPPSPHLLRVPTRRPDVRLDNPYLQ